MRQRLSCEECGWWRVFCDIVIINQRLLLLNTMHTIDNCPPHLTQQIRLSQDSGRQSFNVQAATVDPCKNKWFSNVEQDSANVHD